MSGKSNLGEFTPDDGRSYIAIDLKSFFASVECVERGLDPLTTNLVVADASRTEKTICLAVTPSLKAHGVGGRARLFEVVQKVKEVNIERKQKAPGKQFTGESYNANELKDNPSLAVGYITAIPRMSMYVKYSTKIYDIYLKYVAPEDTHVYSIDEVFLDVTDYLKTYKITPYELAKKIIYDVYHQTGITATAGIGTNLYLCKVAMDIVAKHIPADENGARIAELDEMSYRKLLWNHYPLTDFWRVGRGYRKKLEENGMYTMGDVARCSIGDENEFYNEGLLYKLFGINAELLIDHAWGWEPTRISDIRGYKPETNSISSGQVLQCPYNAEKGRLIIKEMTDLLVLDLVAKHKVTDQMVLTIIYDIENLSDPEISRKYKGEVTHDFYGRPMPKHAHGTINLDRLTSSTKIIMNAVLELYDRIMNPDLLMRKVYVVAAHIVDEEKANEDSKYEQLNLFTDYETIQKEREEEQKQLDKEKKVQKAVLDIKNKFGKNAIVKGMNLEEGGTTIQRNSQIGGHRS